MLIEIVRMIRDFFVKNSKLVFPVNVIAAVALTMVIALNVGNSEKKEEMLAEESSQQEVSDEVVMEPVNEEVPLVLNEDSGIASLLTNYYNAMALGDSETLETVCDEISDKDMLRYVEIAKYIEYYPVIEIYTKPGYDEGSTIAYVYYRVKFEKQEAEFPGYQAYYICTDEKGDLYIKRGDNTEEANEYIQRVSGQDDVVEFNNRINTEYNDLMAAKPALLEYLSELNSQVSTAVGEGLAQLASQQGQSSGTDAAGSQESGAESEGTGTEEAGGTAVLYAVANTTVNVRSSDSEQADKLGKVAGGERVQVLEQRMNGWSKVKFGNKEGFIKSEYLELAESADGAETIGTVKATTNINVRVSPSESAEKLGVLTGGDTAELISRENGWCKIKYNGRIAYVKADYVE